MLGGRAAKLSLAGSEHQGVCAWCEKPQALSRRSRAIEGEIDLLAAAWRVQADLAVRLPGRGEHDAGAAGLIKGQEIIGVEHVEDGKALHGRCR